MCKQLCQICSYLPMLVVSSLLLWSGLSHLGNQYYFLSSVYSYELTNPFLGKWIAIFLPDLQIFLGLCLLLRWWQIEVYLLSLILFSLFLFAQISALNKGLNISCGCFGSSSSLQVGATTLTIASTGWLLSLLGLIQSYRSRKIIHQPDIAHGSIS